MKKNLILALTVLMLTPSAMFATEGMWVVAMLNKINEAEMQGLGLKLSKDDIYNINQASLKDAIVRWAILIWWISSAPSAKRLQRACCSMPASGVSVE